MANLKKEALYYPNYDGVVNYRIPSMITTKKGTVIAGIDARIVDQTDNPNQIEIAIRRSEDHGETFDEIQRLVKYPGEGLDGAAAIDSSLLQDEVTGRIFMMYLHTPGGIGLWNSTSGVGFDEEGRKQLFDQEKNIFYLEKDGSVINELNEKTDYFVDQEGNVTYKGEQAGNIYLKEGIDENESLLEGRTSFLQMIHSDDDGLTWCKPRDINTFVKEEWMRFIGAGPGQGIQLKYGDKKGRLVYPIYFSNLTGHMSSTLIYSDDHGETWKRGDSPNDGRIVDGKELKAETIDDDKHMLTESQVIELPSGELRYYLRNHYGTQRTAIATSNDGGETWGEVTFDEALLDPICQSTVVVYPDQGDGKVRVLFANPADEKTRIKGTVRLSEDGGQTWSYSKVVEEGHYGYSCLTVLKNGEIGLLYERVEDYSDWNKMDIQFTKFSLDWLKS